MYWYDQSNKATIKKINRLMKEIDRSLFSGIGKPEPLKHDLSGKWSRRITDEHRLIYRVDKKILYIYSCKDHY